MAGAVDAIGLHARLRPHAIAAEDLTHGKRWTYAALNQSVGQGAAALKARGTASRPLRKMMFGCRFSITPVRGLGLFMCR